MSRKKGDNNPEGWNAPRSHMNAKMEPCWEPCILKHPPGWDQECLISHGQPTNKEREEGNGLD